MSSNLWDSADVLTVIKKIYILKSSLFITLQVNASSILPVICLLSAFIYLQRCYLSIFFGKRWNCVGYKWRLFITGVCLGGFAKLWGGYFSLSEGGWAKIFWKIWSQHKSNILKERVPFLSFIYLFQNSRNVSELNDLAIISDGS